MTGPRHRGLSAQPSVVATTRAELKPKSKTDQSVVRGGPPETCTGKCAKQLIVSSKSRCVRRLLRSRRGSRAGLSDERRNGARPKFRFIHLAFRPRKPSAPQPGPPSTPCLNAGMHAHSTNRGHARKLQLAGEGRPPSPPPHPPARARSSRPPARKRLAFGTSYAWIPTPISRASLEQEARQQNVRRPEAFGSRFTTRGL